MTQTITATAGTLSTFIFVASTLPMIAKAIRTRDLASYSAGNLIMSNSGNLVYAIYVTSLPIGPVWALHGFNTAASATMLGLWLRHHMATNDSTISTATATKVTKSATAPALLHVP